MMNRPSRAARVIALVLSLLMMTGSLSLAETGGNTMTNDTTHFVPENPDQDAARQVALDLLLHSEGGTDTADGLLLEGQTVTKLSVALPFQLMKGQHLTMTISGTFLSENDKALRVYLTDDSMNNCSKGTILDIENNGGSFSQRLELTAGQPANAIMLSTTYMFSQFDRVLVQDITLEVTAEVLAGIDPSVPYARAVTEDWYQPMLQDSWVNLGNNQRLCNVLERARNGEKITVATIGGSITEGAGATNYRECWAYRTWDGIRKRCGENARVDFVNAGVGGTPSTFGWMRYQRDIADRVNDDDGLPDIVIIEYSVNDGGEPTNHQCVESMVRQILSEPNHPAVILLYAVFISGYNLQKEFRPIGDALDLMQVSIKNGPFKLVGSKWTQDGFFYDQYHPTSLGHAVMADCILSAIDAAVAQPVSQQDIDLSAEPAYGLNYMGLQTIYAHSDNTAVQLGAGSFGADDTGSYTNLPVGRVCGQNFHHTASTGNEPLCFTAVFKNLLIAYRTVTDNTFGNAIVYIDGKQAAVLKANTGSWGQSVVDLVYSTDTAAEHTVSICMA